MKIENLINEVYSSNCDMNEFHDFVTVCTEASKNISIRLQSKNIMNILEYGFEDEYITFYINKYIESNSLFEKYNIFVNVVEDDLDLGKKKKKKKEKYPFIRTEVSFPIELLFEKQIVLRRAKK